MLTRCGFSGIASLARQVALRLTTTEEGEYHVTIPRHAALRVGTLAGILADVAGHFGMSRDELIAKLFRDE